MISGTNFVKASTPVSTISSLATTNTTNTSTAVQSGPYTKAQCKLFLSLFINYMKFI
jgi:hypothetical protein